MPVIGTSFMPETNTGLLSIYIELPEGSSLGEVNEAAINVERVLAADPDVQTFDTGVGTSSAMLGAIGAFLTSGGGNTANIQVVIVSDADDAEVASRLTEDLTGVIESGTVSVNLQEHTNKYQVECKNRAIPIDITTGMVYLTSNQKGGGFICKPTV